MSTFNGEIIELPGVCVDKFDDDKFEVYFLSHCHTDHLQGLENSNKINVSLYCTELSAHFLKQRYPQHEDQIKIVSIGSPLLIQEKELNFQVTFIPAGHCAGSSMILFQTEEQDILYTGDFRISKKDIENLRILRELKNLVVNMDSTFMKKSYMHFPSQSESVAVIIEEIEKFLNKSTNHKVSLIVPAKIGYENLILQIYDNTKEKIFIENNIDSGFEYISELRSCLSKDKMKSRIFLKLKPRYNSFLEEKDPNTLNIKLSAMIWSNWQSGEKILRYENETDLRICYATHSSFSEIRDFLTFLKPSKIYLNVIPESVDQKLQMLKELEEIQSTYTEKLKVVDTVPEKKKFTFKRVREMSETTSMKSNKKR